MEVPLLHGVARRVSYYRSYVVLNVNSVYNLTATMAEATLLAIPYVRFSNSAFTYGYVKKYSVAQKTQVIGTLLPL